jgi:pilus assembly protein CpaB
MKRPVIGIIAALVLGLGGTFALVQYVQSAKEQAQDPEPTTSVLVVQEGIRQGAPLSEISRRVVAVEVPDRLLAAGVLDSLDGVPAAAVAAMDLRPGEQLLGTRLVEPGELVRVEVPAGLQELTVALDPERAVGGTIEAGRTVGLVLSFDPVELGTAGQGAATEVGVESGDPVAAIARRTLSTTHLTLNQILVTSVQFSRQDAERATETRVIEDAETQTAVAANIAESPRDRLLVTFAVTAAEVEQIVFAAEFGRIWLTGQNEVTQSEGTRILSLDQAYIAVPR